MPLVFGLLLCVAVQGTTQPNGGAVQAQVPDNVIPDAAEAATPDAQGTVAADAETARFERLAERYERIVRRNPRPGTAFNLWYQHYLDAGRREVLTERVRGWTEAAPKDAELWLLRGLVSERTGQAEEAEEAYRRSVALAPDDPQAARQLGEYLARQGEIAEAIQLLQRAVAAEPAADARLATYRQLGRLQLRNGQPRQALETWDQMVQSFPEDRAVREELAELLTEQRLVEPALRRWAEVLELAPEDPAAGLRARLAMADLHASRGATEDSLRLLERALADVEPDSWQARQVRDQLRRVFLQADDAAGWLRFWTRRKEEFPEDVNGRLELVRALAAADQEAAAIAELRELTRLAPARREVHQTLVDRFRAAGHWDEAIEAARRLLAHHPRDPDGWEQLGRLYLQTVPRTDSAEHRAVAAWTRLAQLRPEDPSAALRAAELCREYLPAFSAGEPPTQAGPSPAGPEPAGKSPAGPTPAEPTPTGPTPAGPTPAGPTPADRRAVPAETAPLLATAAERFYREAVRRGSGEPRYWESLGEFLHDRDRPEEALAAWRHLVEPPQDSPANRRRLWELYQRHGYADEALEMAARTVAGEQPEVDWWIDYARLLLDQGQVERAVGILPKLLAAAAAAARGQLDQAIETYVGVCDAAGQVERRIEQLRRGDGGVTDAPLRRRLLASLWAARYRWPEAIAELREAVEAEPENTPLRLHYAATLEQAGRLAEAAEQYRALMRRDPRQMAVHGAKLIQLELDRELPDAARRTLDTLLERSPNNVELWQLSADLGLRQGQVELALDALRAAARIDPRNLDRRRQLAAALVAHGHPEEGREHYWRCFEMSDSPEQKQQLALAMAASLTSDEQRETLIQQLQSPRFRDEDPLTATLCAVAVWRQAGRYEEAERILRELLRRQPRQPEALRNLADVARGRNQTSAAIEAQRQLAELTDDPSDWETLALDYAHAGEHTASRDVWRQLLRRTGDERRISRAVDRHLAAGEWEAGLSLASWGASQLPTSWRLTYRAALGNLALGRLDAADDGFAALRSGPAAKSAWDEQAADSDAAATSTSGNPPNGSSLLFSLKDENCLALRELQQAALAQERFAKLHEAGEAPSSPSGTLSGQRTTAAPPSGAPRAPSGATLPRAGAAALLALPETSVAARVESVVGTYMVAVRQRRVAVWEQRRWDRAEDDPDALWELVLARAAAGRTLAGWDAVTQLVVQRPDDPLPHLARLTVRVNSTSEAWRKVANRRERFSADMRESYLWLRERRPVLARQLQEHVANQLLALSDAEAVSELLRAALKDARGFHELAELTSLVLAADDKALRLQWLKQAVAGVQGAKESPSPDAAREVAAEDLHFLLARRLDAESSTPCDAEETACLLQLFDALLRTDSATPSGGPAGPRADYLARAFPAETHLFNARQARLLGKLRQLAERQQLEGPLEELLQAGQRAADTLQATRFQMALVHLRWWQDRPRESLQLLDELCAASPTDGELRYALALGHYARKQFRQTLRHLDAIGSPTARLAKAAAELRGHILQRWSGERVLHVLEGHAGVVKSLEYLPDGGRLASGSVDRTVRVWEEETGNRVLTIDDPQDIVLSVACSPRDNLLAVGGYERRIRLLAADSGKPVASLDGHEAPVRCLAFSDDGRWLASADDRGRVHLWEVGTRQSAARLQGPSSGLLSLAFSRDGQRLATGGANGEVTVWDVTRREVLRRLGEHQEKVTAVSFGPEDAVLYAAARDGHVAAWRTDTGELVRREQLVERPINDLALSPDARQLALAGEDGMVRIVGLADWQVVQRLRGHQGAVQTVRFSPNGQVLASGGGDGHIYLWDPLPDAGPEPAPDSGTTGDKSP